LAETLPFPVIGRCRSHLAALLSNSPLSKIPDLPLEFRRYLPQFQSISISGFGGHIAIAGSPVNAAASGHISVIIPLLG